VLHPDRLAADPDLPVKAYKAVRARGVISRAIGGDALQISPPLTMTDGEFEQMLAGFRRGLDDLA
jgi:adenosylmethionine-8-amino-7-oxononanoate aminotransferase